MRELITKVKYIGILIIAGLLTTGTFVTALLPAEPVYAAGTSLSVDMDPATPGIQNTLIGLDVGDNFDVAVVLDTDEETIGAQMLLAWDPASPIECTGVSMGDFYPTGFMTPGSIDSSWIDNTNGWVKTISINQIAVQPAGSGELLVYSFHVIAEGNALFSIIYDDDTLPGYPNPSPVQSTKVIDSTGETIEDVQLNGGSMSKDAQPDLIVNQISETWENEQQGTYKVSYTAENLGSCAADNFEMGLYIDGVKVIEETVTTIASSGSYTGDFNGYVVTMNGNEDTVKVMADTNADLDEISENNNNQQNTLERKQYGLYIEYVPNEGKVFVDDLFRIANLPAQEYYVGTQVTLKAEPKQEEEAYYEFAGWSWTNEDEISFQDNPLTITMDKNYSLEAKFQETESGAGTNQQDGDTGGGSTRMYIVGAAIAGIIVIVGGFILFTKKPWRS